MAAYPITLDGLDLNDGVINTVLGDPGVNFGQPQTTWDEVTSYTGVSNAQVNVHQNQALITVTIPMIVKGTSVSDLHSKLNLIWAKIDPPNGATFASPKNLVIGSITYSIVYSTHPTDLVRNHDYQIGYWCRFTLELTRKP